MLEEYFFEKQRVINIFAQFHMRIEFSLKSIGYNNFNEQMMISEVMTAELLTVEVIKAWYERKVARDGGRLRGRALIAVMRKAVP